MADSTRLPISHPDHSLGAGLGLPSENDGEDRGPDEDPAGADEANVEGRLPWTPKFNKVGLTASGHREWTIRTRRRSV